MNKIIKNLLLILGLYVAYLVLTLVVFYITGMYIWTTPPTNLVFWRIVGFPFALTIITYIFIKILEHIKNVL